MIFLDPPSDPTRTRLVEYLLEYQTIRRWLGELKEGPGRKINIYIFHRYMIFVKAHSRFKDPDHLIADCRDAKIDKLQEHADLCSDYLNELTTVGDSTKSKHRDVIMSFYVNNGLRSVPWRKFKTKNERIEFQDHAEDAKDFVAMMRKAMLLNASPLQRAVLMVTYQSFMDDSTLAYVFNYFAYPQLVKHFGSPDWTKWDENKVPVRIDIVRPKNSVQGWTCLHRDALALLKDWLNVRLNIMGQPIKTYPNPNMRNFARSDPIFIVGQTNRAIRPVYVSHLFREMGKAAGVNVYTGPPVPKGRGALIRYPFHSHEVRDNARSLAHPLGIGDEVEFFISHKLDVHGYDKSPWKDPQYFLDAYDKLAPWLNVISDDPEKNKLKVELAASKKSFEETSRELEIHSKRLQDQFEKMKLIARLQVEWEMTKDPKKKKQLGSRLDDLLKD